MFELFWLNSENYTGGGKSVLQNNICAIPWKENFINEHTNCVLIPHSSVH